MEEPAATSEFFGAPSTIERSPLDFSNKNPSEQINEGDGAEDQGPETMASVVPPVGPLLTTGAAPTIVEEEEMAADAYLVSKRCRKRANKDSNVNASRKGSALHVSAPALIGDSARIMNPDPITFARIPRSSWRLDMPSKSSKGATVAGGPEPDPTSPTIVMSPRGIYQLEWGVTNGCRLDTPKPNCKEIIAQVARSDQSIQSIERREEENLETLFEAEADMKGRVAKNAQLDKEMESHPL
ncbi:hypothetical protein Tco_0824183 [Tanacetum coccineum]|uniref:Uncharacterized protein n=1 Tax=Tanacetum coccineum TaxID=301880 RepID=A0ABQ5APP5_9ASTR